MSFSFKQFKVEDGRCSMKIGTDGVLLGVWSDPRGARSVLDVGAGSGLVSLMIAQRTDNDVNILASEIDCRAADDCLLNFKESPWTDRLKVVNGDCFDIEGTFDLIISNPPFFYQSFRSPDDSRALARQGKNLNYESLIVFSTSHLGPEGSLAMITEYLAKPEILFSAEMAGLKLRRFCTVRSKVGREPKRILWQFYRKDGEIERSDLVIRDGLNNYTADFKSLTSQFYLDK